MAWRSMLEAKARFCFWAGSFVPITLEQLARERGVLLSDKTTPCGLSFDPTTSDVGGRSSLAPRGPSSAASAQCIIYFLGWEMNTASFAMYTFSLSVLVQALLIISISGAADHGTPRTILSEVASAISASLPGCSPGPENAG